MADVNPQDIMKMLLDSANAKKTFADKLREDRVKLQGQYSDTQNVLKQYDQQTTPKDLYTSNGVALAPSSVIAGRQKLAGAFSSALDPYSPELQLKYEEAAQNASNSRDSLLTEIYKLSQKDQPSEPTLTEKLKALELGYTIDENGNPVKSSSTDVDKEIIKTWATGLKNGTAKFTDIPEKLQSDVLKEMSSSSTEMSKSAEKAVGIISELEKLNTGGITGKARWAWTDKARKAEGLLKQLNSELQIEESKRLKGQGSMSDAERAILANAVSGFNLDENGRSRLSDKDFKAELGKLKTGLSGQGSTSAAYDEDKLLKDMGIGGK